MTDGSGSRGRNGGRRKAARPAKERQDELQALRQELSAANQELQALRPTRVALEQEIATLRSSASLQEDEREATLRGILNAARESIWLFGADGKVLSGNETALQRWGAAPDTIIGKHVCEALPGPLGESRMARVREVVVSGAPVAFEDERAGIAFEHRFYPIVGRHSCVERVACFSRDVTSRKRAEQERERLVAELQQRAAEMDAIFASMVDGVVVYSGDGQRVFANQAAEDILRSTPEERATTDLANRAHMMSYLAQDGSPLALEQTPIAKALRGEASKRAVMRLPRPDGEVWVSVSASPIRGAGGEIRGAVATLRDITESKQMEARMAWLASFPQRNPLPITEVSPSGQIHYINPSACRLFPELEHQQLQHAWLSDWQKTVEALRASPDPTWEREIAVDGRHYLQSMHLLPDVGRIRIYGRDITSHVQAEESLNQANLRLQQADLHKDEFLAMLSHELRNPLAPIRNSLYILDRAAPESEAAGRARMVISRQVAHVSRLVDDLLDTTRISRGKVRLQRRALDFCELVRRVCEDLHELFLQGGIELLPTLPEMPIWIDGDPARLSQAVGNLLHNTLKFTDKGGRVWVTLACKEGQAILRVRDTGAGIPESLLPRLFEPFAQAESTLDRAKGGLGLGLALVKNLVALHGGQVSAHSPGLGQGAEFLVQLPVIPAPVSAPPDTAAPVQPRIRRRVLVIEDNVDAALSLAEVLELGGHEVAVAYQGPEGLAKAKDSRPDIVLCDIGLPGMDGYQVARRLREDPALAGVRLVALSGYTMPEDVQRAASAGFDRHLAKPPTIEQIEALLSSLS